MQETLQWTDLVMRLAAPYGSPAIVLAVIYMESLGDPTLVNTTTQATGLMQVIPQEALAQPNDRPAQKELLDPETNIREGLKILNSCMTEARTLWGALYLYSGGEHWESPMEFTQAYYLPFCEAWATIEHHLIAQARAMEKKQRGRLPVRPRHKRR